MSMTTAGHFWVHLTKTSGTPQRQQKDNNISCLLGTQTVLGWGIYLVLRSNKASTDVIKLCSSMGLASEGRTWPSLVNMCPIHFHSTLETGETTGRFQYVIVNFRKLEEAMAVSRLLSGLPEEISEKSRHKFGTFTNYTMLKLLGFRAPQKRQTCHEPWVDTALELVPTFSARCFLK